MERDEVYFVRISAKCGDMIVDPLYCQKLVFQAEIEGTSIDCPRTLGKAKTPQSVVQVDVDNRRSLVRKLC